MTPAVEIVVGPGGEGRCIYTEDIDLAALGEVDVVRASHVEPSESGGWSADLSPVGGPTLGPFARRSEALAAEVHWLREHWLITKPPTCKGGMPMPTQTLSPPSMAPTTADTASVTLYYREGSSDKVYQAAIEPRDSGFVVTFAFGRRGSTLTTGTKTPSPVPHDVAKKIFDKLVREKTAKGYTPGSEGTPYQHTDREHRSAGVLPQLLNPIEERDVEPFLTDDRWWMQEKLDGRRVLVRKDAAGVTAINRTGLTVGLPQAVAAAVTELASGACLIDREMVGDAYHAFDLLEQEAVDLRPSPYAIRYDHLLNLVDAVPSNHLLYVPAATGTATKRTTLACLRDQKREGVVFKDRGAPYTPGRPPSGGTQRKLKFTATASCLIAGVNGGRRSVALDLFDGDGRRLGVGSVTIPPSQPIPRAGTVVEVRYLYAFAGGSLYQPVFLGVRDDIAARDCTMAQLKLKPADDAEEG